MYLVNESLCYDEQPGIAPFHETEESRKMERDILKFAKENDLSVANLRYLFQKTLEDLDYLPYSKLEKLLEEDT